MRKVRWVWIVVTAVGLVCSGSWLSAQRMAETAVQVASRMAGKQADPGPRSAEYTKVQERLARGWNTWDVHSVATQVLLPDGLAIHVGMKQNGTSYGDTFLANPLIGRIAQNAEVVTAGPHSWDGSYTDLQIAWQGFNWRIQSAHDGADLVLLVTPLPSPGASALPPTVVFTVDYLWNSPGTARRQADSIEARSNSRTIPIYCTCRAGQRQQLIDLPGGGPYFASDLTSNVGLNTGRRRTLNEIESAMSRQEKSLRSSLGPDGKNKPILDAIETSTYLR